MGPYQNNSYHAYSFPNENFDKCVLRTAFDQHDNDITAVQI